MKGYFIVCEGTDCSGKTTAIKRSMKYFQDEDFEVVYNKGLNSETIAGRFAKRYPSTLTYLAELLYQDNIIIKPSLRKGKRVLQDRWYYSVLSHKEKSRKDKLLEKIFIPRMSKPDILVYFSCEREDQIKRLEEKARRESHHLQLLEHPELLDQREERMLDYYNKFPGNRFVIDTSTFGEEDSAYILYEAIRKHTWRNKKT